MQTHDTQRTKHNRGEATSNQRTVAPVVDIYENERELLVIADLPGVTRDRIDIQFEPERLTIEARRPVGDTVLLYKRAFTVAPIFDAEKVTAQFDHGVLRLTLGKSAAVQPRQIPVMGG